MNLNTLTTYIRKYGLLFMVVVFFVFFSVLFFNRPKLSFNFNTNLAYQKEGPDNGSYTPIGYQTNSFSGVTFYLKVTNGQIRYFKILSGNTTGYFINNSNLRQYENNPMYLGDSLALDIFNIPILPLNQANSNYEPVLLNHFGSIPSYLMSKKIYTYLSSNLKDFYPTNPVLKSVSIIGYKEGSQYDIAYSYFAVPLLAQSETQPFVKKIDIILSKVAGSWKPVGIKIL
ncbi:MAG: hypothetical protein ACYDBX_00415 [Patescibacteria group bacterium]